MVVTTTFNIRTYTQRFSGESDEWQNFDTKAIMDYGEYASLCNKWHLRQKYSNKRERYIVVAYAYSNSLVKAALAGVEYDGDTANLYIWDDSYGVVADIAAYAIAAYAIVVPINDNNVQNIEVISTLNEGDWQGIVDPATPQPSSSGLDRPIIYIYPKADTNVAVQLGKPETVTVSYPIYNTQTGWNVLAKPSGELVDLQSGRSLYALYYESNLSKEAGFKIESNGFVVKSEDVAVFLEDKLSRLELNEREAEELSSIGCLS